jgi:hypothetical protein
MSRDVLLLIHPTLGAFGIFASLWVLVEVIGLDPAGLRRTRVASLVVPGLMLATWLGGGLWDAAYYSTDQKIPADLPVQTRLRASPDRHSSGSGAVADSSLGAGRQLDDLGGDFFLAQLVLASAKPDEFRLDIGLGGRHRHHPGLVLGREGAHRGFAELRIDMFACKSFEQHPGRNRDQWRLIPTRSREPIEIDRQQRIAIDYDGAARTRM